MGSWMRTTVYFKKPINTQVLHDFLKDQLDVEFENGRETTDGFGIDSNPYKDSAQSLYKVFCKLPVDFEMIADDGNNTEDTGTISYAPDHSYGIIERRYEDCGTYPGVDRTDKNGTVRKVMEAPTGRTCHSLPNDMFEAMDELPELDQCGLLASVISWPASVTAPRTITWESEGRSISAVYAPKKLLAQLPVDLGKFEQSAVKASGSDSNLADDRTALIQLGKFALVCMLMDDSQIQNLLEQAAKTENGMISKKDIRIFTELDMLVNGKYYAIYAKAGRGTNCQIALGFYTPEYIAPADFKRGTVPMQKLLTQIKQRMSQEGTTLLDWVKANVNSKKLDAMKK